MTKVIQLMCPQEALMLGNIDKDLYCPYKGFTNYPLMAKTVKGQLLSEVMIYDFYCHELNLYLDTHPNDVNAIKLYNEYNKQEKILNDEYERKYGPVNLSDSEGLSMTPWAWIKEPWPWNE